MGYTDTRGRDCSVEGLRRSSISPINLSVWIDQWDGRRMILLGSQWCHHSLLSLAKPVPKCSHKWSTSLHIVLCGCVWVGCCILHDNWNYLQVLSQSGEEEGLPVVWWARVRVDTHNTFLLTWEHYKHGIHYNDTHRWTDVRVKSNSLAFKDLILLFLKPTLILLYYYMWYCCVPLVYTSG